MDALAQEFMALPEEKRFALVREAKRKASQGLCFLCKWITEKIRLEEFPRPARIAHLMLCCSSSSLPDNK